MLVGSSQGKRQRLNRVPKYVYINMYQILLSSIIKIHNTNINTNAINSIKIKQ